VWARGRGILSISEMLNPSGRGYPMCRFRTPIPTKRSRRGIGEPRRAVGRYKGTREAHLCAPVFHYPNCPPCQRKPLPVAPRASHSRTVAVPIYHVPWRGITCSHVVPRIVKPLSRETALIPTKHLRRQHPGWPIGLRLLFPYPPPATRRGGMDQPNAKAQHILETAGLQKRYCQACGSLIVATQRGCPADSAFCSDQCKDAYIRREASRRKFIGRGHRARRVTVLR
jgi:hypothetical protein